LILRDKKDLKPQKGQIKSMNVADKMNLNNLLSHRRNIYSQNGEDGIIEIIFSEIGIEHYACCEFGAWDGIHLSNCRKLILEGWNAVMIEGDADKFNDLCKTYKDNDRVKAINMFIDSENNSLDRILGDNKIENLDFLSIDIDGLDYQIFESLKIRPRVICVEINAGHSPDDVGGCLLILQRVMSGSHFIAFLGWQRKWVTALFVILGMLFSFPMIV
jgi:hypothetical protein